MSDHPASPSHAVCVYAEPLVAGRRVIVIDDCSRGLGERLIELGARTVHVYDPEGSRARARSASKGVTLRELPAGEFDVRDGAFDVAILPDLGLVEEPAALLARVRRLIGPDGAALVAAHNPEATFRLSDAGPRPLDYYELYDFVALQFAHVRMIGQVPFVGLALAELGLEGDEPEVSVDTQLVGEMDPPELFLALASQKDVRLAEYAIVQLPSAALTLARDAGYEETGPHSHHAQLAEAQLKANVLSAQLDDHRERSSRTLGVDEESARRARELEATLVERDAMLADRAAMLAERDAILEQADARTRELGAHASRLAEELRALEDEVVRQRDLATRAMGEADQDRGLRDRVAALEHALGTAQATAIALGTRLVEAEDAIATREAQLAALVVEVEAAGTARADALQHNALASRLQATEAREEALQAELAGIAHAHAAELVQLEEALRDRGRAAKEVGQEMLRREALVHELIAALEEARAEGSAEGSAGEVNAEVQAQAREDAHARDVQAPSADLDEAVAALREDKTLLAGKLDALALEVARREADVATSAWRIAELEQQVARLEASTRSDTEPPARPAASPGGGAPPNAPLDELSALRQALAQEHEARVRLESGDELAKARAELSRQAVLLEQLGRELDAKDRVRRDDKPGALRDA